jgi:hypothetical protein
MQTTSLWCTSSSSSIEDKVGRDAVDAFGMTREAVPISSKATQLRLPTQALREGSSEGVVIKS